MVEQLAQDYANYFQQTDISKEVSANVDTLSLTFLFTKTRSLIFLL